MHFGRGRGFDARGIKGEAYLIKPNLYEFQMAFGLKTKEQKANFGDLRIRLLAQGVEIVCLSMGGDGAMIVSSREAYICKPTPIDVKSTAGAGDSLVAGMCIAMEEGRDLGRCFGTGCRWLRVLGSRGDTAVHERKL